MKVSVLTLGCKANQAESAQIEAGLRERGCEIVDLGDGPDVCIVNTCSVTSRSDYQSRQLIRRASRSGSAVIVTGCYAELNARAVSGMEAVRGIIGNDDKINIISLVTGGPSSATLSPTAYSKSRFLLKIQDGCDNACSYCIIPRARGRSRSSDPRQLIETVRRISEGYKEIVITGIHIGTYGYDLNPKTSLAALIASMLETTHIERIRLSSIEVGELNDELLDVLSDERLCNHLHIPLQSGDDEILRKMNRGYTSRDFTAAIERVCAKFPGVGLGTDVIAGFPGENEASFLRTMELIGALPFSYLHVFPYSARQGTPSSFMGGMVNAGTKKQRCASLRALSKEKREAFMSAQLGKVLDVLVEEKVGEDRYSGTTGNYLKMTVHLDRPLLKRVVSVRATAVEKGTLVGELIEET